jgi:hypothetical protein
MAPVFAQTAPPCLSKWPSRSSSTPAKAEAGVIGSLSACEPGDAGADRATPSRPDESNAAGFVYALEQDHRLHAPGSAV